MSETLRGIQAPSSNAGWDYIHEHMRYIRFDFVQARLVTSFRDCGVAVTLEGIVAFDGLWIPDTGIMLGKKTPYPEDDVVGNIDKLIERQLQVIDPYARDPSVRKRNRMIRAMQHRSLELAKNIYMQH
jgi:hypothetical protein